MPGRRAGRPDAPDGRSVGWVPAGQRAEGRARWWTSRSRPQPRDEYDPFEAFEDVIGGDVRDPYPDFADKRAHDPVWQGSFMNHELLPEGIEVGDDWLVFRYDDCSRGAGGTPRPSARPATTPPSAW